MTTPDAHAGSALSPPARAALVRRGLTLSRVTLGYNSAEAIASLAAGVLTQSPALVGFGVDSLIEVTSSAASLWRLREDHDVLRRARAERTTRRIVAACFLALAAYVAVESGKSLLVREQPQRTLVGVVILTLSLVVMPMLARRKRRVASALGSRTLAADATQTSLCAYLSAIALAGVALNALLGWWWADPLAALAMCPIILKEGLDGLRGDDTCSDCA